MKHATVLGFSSLFELMNLLPMEEACRKYLKLRIWGNCTPICSYCGSGKHYILKIKIDFSIENGTRLTYIKLSTKV